jgi:hypothetical protein
MFGNPLTRQTWIRRGSQLEEAAKCTVDEFPYLRKCAEFFDVLDAESKAKEG